jgi:hypothetical protein
MAFQTRLKGLQSSRISKFVQSNATSKSSSMSHLPGTVRYEGKELSPEELAFNLISKTSNGAFYCALCWKTPQDEGRLVAHLHGREHQRRVRNKQYEVDPLSHVPQEHLEFTALSHDGWPTCTLCNKRVDEKHWSSDRHTKMVEYYKGRRLTGVDTPPPLPPTPPPPPSKPPDGCGIAVGHVDVTSATPRQMPQDNIACASSAVSQFASQPPWGSRGPGDEVLNDEEWEEILRKFDERYIVTGDCWPIDQEVWFFHV